MANFCWKNLSPDPQAEELCGLWYKTFENQITFYELILNNLI